MRYPVAKIEAMKEAEAFGVDVIVFGYASGGYDVQCGRLSWWQSLTEARKCEVGRPVAVARASGVWEPVQLPPQPPAGLHTHG
jgi:hypothetical protein